MAFSHWHKAFHALVIGGIIAFIALTMLMRRDVRTVSPQHSVSAVRREVITKRADHVEALRGDAIGGATPEETFDGFTRALAADDAEAAAAFFDVSRREGWRETLVELKGIGGLPRMAEEVAAVRAAWVPAEQEDDLAVYLRGEERVTFVKNPYSGKWKLYEL